jgi:hypothetical protein
MCWDCLFGKVRHGVRLTMASYHGMDDSKTSNRGTYRLQQPFQTPDLGQELLEVA